MFQCGLDGMVSSIAVTYDLAIAKIAMQLQAEVTKIC